MKDLVEQLNRTASEIRGYDPEGVDMAILIERASSAIVDLCSDVSQFNRSAALEDSLHKEARDELREMRERVKSYELAVENHESAMFRVAELEREVERQTNNCLNLQQQVEDMKAQAGVPVYQLQCREIGEGDWCPADLRHYTYCQQSPEMDTRIVEVQKAAAPSPSKRGRDQ